MNWLAENALPIWVGGAVALTMALVVFYHTRGPKSLAAVAAVLVVTIALLSLEQQIETPREEVERTLYELAATVEANDVAGALYYLAPTAPPRIRREIEQEMPLVRIDRANVRGSPKIEVASGPDPNTATAHCRGFIVGILKQNGMKVGAEDEITLEFVRNGERWQVESYTSKKNWDLPRVR
jgi:hypothetical protein